LIAREREFSRFLRPFTYKDGKNRIALHVFEKNFKKIFQEHEESTKMATIDKHRDLCYAKSRKINRMKICFRPPKTVAERNGSEYDTDI
jgi:hypothetical protein